jgi:hypothetical protein
MLNNSEIHDTMRKLRNGEQLDLCLSNGAVRSSKTCTGNPQEDGTLIVEVWHSISDHFETFSEPAFKEVLLGDRSFWDGDMTEPNDDEDEYDDNEPNSCNHSDTRICQGLGHAQGRDDEPS